MNIQDELLKLSKDNDLSRIPLRKIADMLGKSSMSPGHLQHHFSMLDKRGLLFIDRKKKLQRHGDVLMKVSVMPDGRSMAFIPFKNYKIVDVDGCEALVEDTSNAR